LRWRPFGFKTRPVRDLPALERFLRRCRRLQLLAKHLPEGQAYLTGGSLRDALLGLPLTDLDLALPGKLPEIAQDLAKKLGGKAFPLGKPPLLTYRLVAGSLTVDLWALPASLEEDAWRRDFTVNALFYRLPAGPLLDFCRGLADAQAGKLQVVKEENLHQDPLRLLRALRLVLSRPLTATPETERLVQKAAPKLALVAPERLRQELSKLLAQAPLPEIFARGLAWGFWQALSVVPSASFPSPEAFLKRLELAKQSRGPWRQAAQSLAWAAFAYPRLAAGEGPEKALPSGLQPLGITGKTLAHLQRVVALGEALLVADNPKALLALHRPQREALLWWFARGDLPWEQVRRWWRWWVRFFRRPPLVPSQEACALASLPPGPERARLLQELRQLQALGKLRSPAALRRYLQATRS
jgi:hypothetical protein